MATKAATQATVGKAVQKFNVQPFKDLFLNFEPETLNREVDGKARRVG
jgi:hypothetical protein